MTNKKEQFKIVFTGSVGAGKTTAINSISEKPIISTDVKATEKNVLRRKKTTTTAMDYGQISLDDGEKLFLYGTPGQRRFDFMSSILCQGAMGLIVLLDNTHENALDEMDYYLNLNAAFLTKNPAVIGVTHYDLNPHPDLTYYQNYLHERGDAWPVLRADARDSNDVIMLVSALLATLEHG